SSASLLAQLATSVSGNPEVSSKATSVLIQRGETFDDKFGSSRCNPPFSFYSVDPACHLCGAGARADSRTDCQDLRSRVLWASRSHPLHLEWGNPRNLQAFSRVGVGAEDQ